LLDGHQFFSAKNSDPIREASFRDRRNRIQVNDAPPRQPILCPERDLGGDAPNARGQRRYRDQVPNCVSLLRESSRSSLRPAGWGSFAHHTSPRRNHHS